MRLSIGAKLALGILIPLLVIYAVVVWIDYRESRDSALRLMRQQSAERAELLASRLNTAFTAAAKTAEITAELLTSNVGFTQEDDLYRLLEANVNVNTLVYGSCIAFAPRAYDPDRERVAPYVFRNPFAPGVPERAGSPLQLTDLGTEGYNYLDPKWTWYHEVLKTRKALWTEPYEDTGASNALMCTYSTPLYMRGSFRGVVTVNIRLSDIRSLLLPQESNAQEYFILSGLGTYIVHPDEQRQGTANVRDAEDERAHPGLAELARRMIAGEHGIATRLHANDGTRDVVAFAPIAATGWSLGASINERVFMAPVNDRLWRSMLFFLLGLGVIAGAVLFSALRIIAPLRLLTGEIDRLGAGHLEEPDLPVRSRDEFGELAGAFNRMRRELRGHIAALQEQAAARQKAHAELQIARQIQAGLLPRSFPSDPRFDVHGTSVSAEVVGGDFFDCFMVDPHTLALVIADVSGKGVPAAIFMAVTRTILRDLLTEGKSPADALARANTLLVSENDQGMFVTALIAHYHAPSGRFTYANAGHPPPVLVEAGGESRLLGTNTGTVIGVLEHARHSEHVYDLLPGESLVLYSDGVTEAKGPRGTFYTPDRLCRTLSDAAHGEPSAQRLCGIVAQDVESFGGSSLSDDTTILALRRPVHAPAALSP